MARSCRHLRILLPHFLIVFTFSAYIFLGACGLYYLVFPSGPQSISQDAEIIDELDTPLGYHQNPGPDQDFIEMNIDIPCSEAKKRLEELDRHQFQRVQKDRNEELKKFSFTRAVLVCFNWITTIGNRSPNEWEYTESTGITSVSNSLASGGLISKSYALAYMLLGIPLSFLIVYNFSALIYDAWNVTCFVTRRWWHKKVIWDSEEQLRRDVEESRLWNPLWFSLFLISYLTAGAALLQYIWILHGKSLPFQEAVWNCATLVFAIGESTKDIFVVPQTPKNCLFQISYSLIGLILFAAFLRSFLPLAALIYQPRPYQWKKREKIPKKKKMEKPKPIILRQEEGSVIKRSPSKDSPLIPPKKRTPPTPQSATYTPRSILRQRNGAFALEPKIGDSLDSILTDDLLFPPMVRFAMPTPPDEHFYRKPSLEMQAESWPREQPASRPWASEANLTKSPKPIPMPRKSKMKSNSMSSQSSLVFSVSPESIPFADERPSTLIM